jgi:SAM-dependent methyltransferase
VYPEPITDLPAWLVNNWQWFDPSHAYRLFWPNHDYRPEIDILIAGCGSNQAAVFAYSNPGAKIVGIDVSEASLNHQRFLKQKYALDNLELYQLPIEEIESLARDYDLIVATGVLHHLADPTVGMRALAQCLRSDGVAAIMLYARYGRFGVEIMQEIFREIGLNQSLESLVTVKEAIAQLPKSHPLHSYLSVAPDLQFDAGLVDTFLHSRDRSYTVKDCLDLVASAGLAFQSWFFKSYYEPPTSPGSGFYTAVLALPNQQRWGVMERINTSNACHFFIACRSDRSLATYVIDLTSARGLDAVPHFRYRCGIENNAVYKFDWQLSLNPDQFTLVSLVDGHRTLREIVAEAARNTATASHDSETLEADARQIFQALVNRDLITLGIRQ